MPQRIADKMGIRQENAVVVINAPAGVMTGIELPTSPATTLGTKIWGHILFFVTTQDQLDTEFPKFKNHLTSDGKLWVIWPKAKQLGTDLNIKEVIRIGYSHNLVESTNLRIDDTWTALKFTHPKPGKIYHNSYGSLP